MSSWCPSWLRSAAKKLISMSFVHVFSLSPSLSRVIVVMLTVIASVSNSGCAGLVQDIDVYVYLQGLTVQLRPYQRQSLQFMMDNENAEGGFRHHLFCSVTNSKGERYWYSPILGRICQDVAAMPQGGILGKSSRKETKRKAMPEAL